jgi:hypothetical protein
LILDLRIELFDKNLFTKEVFLGQSLTPFVELLHTSPNEVITSDLMKKPGYSSSSVKGTVSFKIVTKREPQKLGPIFYFIFLFLIVFNSIFYLFTYLFILIFYLFIFN